jgi:site-specific recombinase XerC
VSEVAQRQRQAIDWSQQAVLVEQGKGRQDRRGYLAAAAVASRRECLTQRPSGAPEAAVCWPQKRPSRTRSVKAIQKHMARDANAAGGVASGHRWRHRCAANGLEPGAEIVSIREWLGHASSSASARYAKASNPQGKQESLRTMTKVLQRSKV